MNNQEICLICNQSISNEHYGLSKHLKSEHNVFKKSDYLDHHVYKIKDYLKCACGCDALVKKHRLWPYKMRYITGHNSKGDTNPRFGITVTDLTKSKMKVAARHRCDVAKQSGITLPYNTKSAIQKRAKRQTDKYIADIQRKCNITIIDTLRRNDIGYYTIVCNVCNHQFNKFHDDTINCPVCVPSPKSSFEERLFVDLSSNLPNVEIKRNVRTVLDNKFELDFYFPSHQLGVEFHGMYYHSELQGKLSSYHLNKLKACEEKDIQLIQIFEDEFINKYDIVLNKILRLVSSTPQTFIHGRSTTVVELSPNDSSAFLDTYHLQNSDNASIRLGLMYNDELVSIMTFAKPNASKGLIPNQSNVYELSRYAVHNAYIVRGGASKLLKYFQKTYAPSRIFSYADLRWVSKHTNLYKTLGFRLVHQSKPNYWYFKTGTTKRYHRFNFTKKRTIELGGNPNNTEWENMQSLGYNRIWDCGHLKYELIL